MTERELRAVAEAIRARTWERNVPYTFADGTTTTINSNKFDIEDITQAAISASDSQYVKGLVEALNAIIEEDECNVRDIKAYARTALQNLPEDRR